MGYEVRCQVHVRDADGMTRTADVTVLLEADELIVRGATRLRVPRSSVREIASADGQLRIEHLAGSLTLALDEAAAAKLRRKLEEAPKSRLAKLDVPQGAKVWVTGINDASFLQELRERTNDITTGGAAARYDVIFLGIDSEEDLARIPGALDALAPGGALWAIHPKGPTGIPDTRIFAVAKDAGLTYTKVVRFSETHTAEKLVRPRASRRVVRNERGTPAR
jgi:hypothetical protein